MTDPSRNIDPDSSENKDIGAQQPGGSVNPKILLAIAAVLVIAGIITLIVLLQGS